VTLKTEMMDCPLLAWEIRQQRAWNKMYYVLTSVGISKCVSHAKADVLKHVLTWFKADKSVDVSG
jgi:hypothetical protein